MTHRPESSEVVFCFLFLENLFLEPAGNNEETITAKFQSIQSVYINLIQAENLFL